MSSNLIYSPSAARVLNSIPSNEHTAGDRTPYCYLIGWTKHNMWYYGRRTAKRCHPSEFWKKYKTSSKYVNEFVSQYGDPDILIIRNVFMSEKICADWENRVLCRINAAKNPLFLNQTNGDALFDNTNKLIVKDSNQNILRVDKNDPRYLSGELVSIVSGTVAVKDSNQNILRVARNDPRYLSGELVGIASGTVTVKDSAGNKTRVDKNDPRYLSGELISNNHGIIIVKNKAGELFGVRKDDPRYLSGELLGMRANIVHAIDCHGEIHKVDIADSRVLSGEFVRVWQKTKEYIDGNGNKIRTTDNDSRVLSGDLKLPNRIQNRILLMNRPEVIYLDSVAKDKNIKLTTSWRWTNDLSKYRDLILNGPSNISYHKK